MAAEPAAGASGNRQGAVYPLLNGDHDTLSRFYLQAFLYGRRALPALAGRRPFSHDWCGVVQLAHDDKSGAKVAKLLEGHFPDEVVRPLDANAVRDTTGIDAGLAGVLYPLGGWVCPFELTRALLAEARASGLLDCRFNTRVTVLSQDGGRWHLNTSGDDLYADNVVLANGHEVTSLHQTEELALYPVRGQVNHQPTAPQLAPLRTVVCYEGYLTPAWQGQHCVGASYGRQQTGLDYRAGDEQDNLDKLVRTLPALQGLQAMAGAGRVGIRAACRDHLPLAGAAPDKQSQLAQYGGMHRKPDEILPLATDHAGLYVLSGLGSRGMCSAPLLAELMAAQLLDEPYPLAREQLAALNPNRHWLRKLQKGKAVD
ncbi:hypothetical protein CGX12_12775 [Zobellella denitrificans]|nr:hypothetical protein CGX12_12775 [Zobellella denitrificans]